MRLRTISLLAILLTPVPLALAGQSTGCTRPLDGSDEATVVVEPTAGFVSGNFVFPCVQIPSDGGVTFVAAGTGEHDIRTVHDSGACFRARNDLGRPLTTGDTWRVQMRYDESGVHRVLEDGTRDCVRAVTWHLSSAERAYLVYECRFHPSFRGIVYVEAAAP